jgi:hypothetical protein
VIKGIQEEWRRGVVEGMGDEDQRGKGEGGAGKVKGQAASGLDAETKIL